MLAEPDATEHTGDVYGFNLIYSGSHFASVEAGPYCRTRVMAGVQPEGFRWTLQPGETFDTPEAVLSFSCRGKNGLSQNMHAFVQRHIVRGEWANKPRPVLLNNWEATYFNFKESTLLRLAREAKDLGVELFVLDDGWFGTATMISVRWAIITSTPKSCPVVWTAWRARSTHWAWTLACGWSRR